MASIYRLKKRLLLSVFERLWRQADEGKRWVLSNPGKDTEFKGRGARGDPERSGLPIGALGLGAVY